MTPTKTDRPGTRMRQAVMANPGEIKFLDADIPETGDDEVLLHTKRIGICGSDVHVFHGVHPYTGYPVVQGHEVAGIVAATGKKVVGFAAGDKVTFTPQVVCGECYPCSNGMHHICESLAVMGFQTGGAAQDYFAVPARNVLKLPDNLSLDQGAMIEPTAVAVHALSRVPQVTGNVLVLGAGTIGNLVAQVAKALGATATMITDLSSFRLQKARECGVDYVVDTRDTDLADAVTTHFGANKADLILECVGVQETVDQAVLTARKGTTVIVVGVFGEKPAVDLGLVQDRELSLVGSLMYQKADFEVAIELVSTGAVWLDPLITHRFGFEDYANAYEFIENSRGEHMKVLVELD